MFIYAQNEDKAKDFRIRPNKFSTVSYINHVTDTNGKGDERMSYGAGGYGLGAGFALIVVLFILLIIVGAAYVY